MQKPMIIQPMIDIIAAMIVNMMFLPVLLLVLDHTENASSGSWHKKHHPPDFKWEKEKRILLLLEILTQ